MCKGKKSRVQRGGAGSWETAHGKGGAQQRQQCSDSPWSREASRDQPAPPRPPVRTSEGEIEEDPTPVGAVSLAAMEGARVEKRRVAGPQQRHAARSALQ